MINQATGEEISLDNLKPVEGGYEDGIGYDIDTEQPVLFYNYEVIYYHESDNREDVWREENGQWWSLEDGEWVESF